jgi:hypothetical protein
MALDAYVKAGLGLALIPPEHLVHVADTSVHAWSNSITAGSKTCGGKIPGGAGACWNVALGLPSPWASSRSTSSPWCTRSIGPRQRTHVRRLLLAKAAGAEPSSGQNVKTVG